MKLLIITLTIISINFGANAKEVIYNCEGMYFKVENPLIGKRKLYMRKEGEWILGCLDGKVFPDSFRCNGNNDENEFIIFDEFLKKVTVHEKNKIDSVFKCKILDK